MTAAGGIKYFEKRLEAKKTRLVHRKNKKLPGHGAGVGGGGRNGTNKHFTWDECRVGMKKGKRKVERQMLKKD